MKLDVLNTEGKPTGRSVTLPADIFGIDPNEHVVYLSAKQYLAHQRQGTHKAKERGEVKGSTRKIKRQKGTGTARAGSIKNPLFRGGGRVFGPRPHKYVINLPKKVKRLARKSALSTKAGAGGIMIIEDFSFDAPKTKQFVHIVDCLQLNDKKALFITSDREKEVYLSSRNLKKADVVEAASLNTYQIMKANTLVFSEGSVKKMKEIFA